MIFTAETWVHIVGTVGALLLLAAYYLVSKKKLDGHSRMYQFLNILGAAGLAVNSGYFHAWPPMVLNLVWIALGIAMIKSISADRKKGDESSGKASS